MLMSKLIGFNEVAGAGCCRMMVAVSLCSSFLMEEEEGAAVMVEVLILVDVLWGQACPLLQFCLLSWLSQGGLCEMWA